MNTRQMITCLLCVLLPAASAAAVTLTNRQDVEMKISRVDICGSRAAADCGSSRYGNAAQDFAISGNTCGNKVAARSSCEIRVNFTPSAAGERTATLRVIDSEGTHNVALSGTGQTADGNGGHDGRRADEERHGKKHEERGGSDDDRR